MKHLTIALAAFLLASFIVVGQSRAVGLGRPGPDDATSSGDSSPSGRDRESLPHLGGKNLTACQAIEKNLSNRSGHLIDLVTRMEKTFTSIAQGVENFYTSRVLPTGKSLPNYSALVADISAKQAAVTPLLAAVQADVTGFSCTGVNPKGRMTQFRTDMQSVIAGLKAYRTSIKNLIVAVHTLVPKETPAVTGAPTVAPTAVPTLAPTVTPSASPSASPTP